MNRLILPLLSLGLVSACSPPSANAELGFSSPGQRTSVDKPRKHAEQHVRTVKPGPAVRVTSELREEVVPGGSGALNVTFTEAYRRGTMTVRASTSAGISLITTNDEESFNMASGDDHEWTLYFDAPEAGRHFVNIHVAVETPFGKLSRKSAAIVQVGKNTGSAVASKSSGSVQTDAEGKRVIMMEAQEVIIQDE